MPFAWLRRSAALTALAIFAAACSSSGTLEMRQQKTETIPPGHTVALSVAGPNDEDSQSVIQDLRTYLFGLLPSQGLFAQVVTPDQPAHYEMDVAVSGVEEVSQGARIFLGVLAGSNDLTTDVTVTDRRTDQVVTSFRAAGESASHPFSSENDMDDAIKEVGTKIVQALR